MADYSQMSDEQLACCVNSSKSGDAVAEIVSRYTGLVLSLAGKFSGGADYEELVSDGLDALIAAASKYSAERGSFSAFAAACVSNRMKNAVRRASRRTEQISGLEDNEDIPDSSPTPEELVISRENAAEMTEQMKNLLSPMELRCIEGVILGMPYSEIAERLSVSVKSVDNAVTRARGKLRMIFPRL